MYTYWKELKDKWEVFQKAAAACGNATHIEHEVNTSSYSILNDDGSKLNVDI